jgi:hypothetical protein
LFVDRKLRFETVRTAFDPFRKRSVHDADLSLALTF